jgi:hypothetical protein
VSTPTDIEGEPVITPSNLVGRRTANGLIAAALLAMGGAGCSGATPSAPPATTPPPTTSTSAALCAAAGDFRTATNQLVEVDPAPVGLDGVKAALLNLGTAGREMADAAAAEFGPQAQDLKEGISALGSTVEGLQNRADLSSGSAKSPRPSARSNRPRHPSWTAPTRAAHPSRPHARRRGRMVTRRRSRRSSPTVGSEDGAGP